MWTTSPQTQILLTASPQLYILEDNEAVIKMIIKGKKGYNETRFQNPQSGSWLVCLIESIWTPRSKSNMLTPRTNSLTFWAKVISRVMSGTIFFVCWMSLISRCLPQEHHVEESSGKEDRRRTCGVDNRDRHVWCQETWAQSNLPHWIRVLRTARGTKSWVGLLFSQALGNLCEGSRTNLQGRSWTSTICKSPTITTLRKSSRIFDRSWIVRRNDQIFDQKVNALIWWLFILGQITMKICFRTGTPASKSSRRCSTLRRGWSWTMGSRFWMFPWLNGNFLHGWDPLCCMTRWSSRRKERYTSTQIQFFVWERCTSIPKQM